MGHECSWGRQSLEFWTTQNLSPVSQRPSVIGSSAGSCSAALGTLCLSRTHLTNFSGLPIFLVLVLFSLIR